LAESTFDRARFAERLATRRLGRTLIGARETGSTTTWPGRPVRRARPTARRWWPTRRSAGGAGRVAPGTPRPGRRWRSRCCCGGGRSPRPGPAFARGGPGGGAGARAAGAGAGAQVAERRAAGGRRWRGSCAKPGGWRARERRAGPARRRPPEAGPTRWWWVVGVNVGQTLAELPPELAGSAISLALAGVARPTARPWRPSSSTRSSRCGGPPGRGAHRRDRRLERARALLGLPVVVRTPTGEVSGTARALDADGALVLVVADGHGRRGARRRSRVASRGGGTVSDDSRRAAR